MARITHSRLPPLGLGLASVALGAIGLMLFVLPILAIPISVCGLVLGLIGFIAAAVGHALDLRLSAAGAALCCLALIIDLAMSYAPTGFLLPHRASPHFAPLLERPYVPPPAPLRSGALVSNVLPH